MFQDVPKLDPEEFIDVLYPPVIAFDKFPEMRPNIDRLSIKGVVSKVIIFFAQYICPPKTNFVQNCFEPRALMFDNSFWQIEDVCLTNKGHKRRNIYVNDCRSAKKAKVQLWHSSTELDCDVGMWK